MKEIRKPVYYCDFCRKHGLSRFAMGKHERTCTLNPDRHCRWHMPDSEMQVTHGQVSFRTLAEELRNRAPLSSDDIDLLHDNVGGCPACMLAVLRQSGVEYHYNAQYKRIWDYEEEIARFREDEREQAR